VPAPRRNAHTREGAPPHERPEALLDELSAEVLRFAAVVARVNATKAVAALDRPRERAKDADRPTIRHGGVSAGPIGSPVAPPQPSRSGGEVLRPWGETIVATGVSGTVTLTSVDAGAFAGSADVTFDSGDHLAFEFSTTPCSALGSPTTMSVSSGSCQ
jgi:hypothetical protein